MAEELGENGGSWITPHTFAREISAPRHVRDWMRDISATGTRCSMYLCITHGHTTRHRHRAVERPHESIHVNRSSLAYY
jgi:hypothetical protein